MVGKRLRNAQTFAVLMVAVVGVGCGASNPSAKAPSSTGSTRSSSPLTADLRPQLISLSDLPAGWSSATFPPAGMDTHLPASVSLFPRTMSAGCLFSISASHTQQGVAPPSAKAEAFYDRGGNVIPSLDELLAYYPANGARAVSFFDTMLSGHCSTAEFTARGHTATGSIRRLSLPTLGDESTAWEIENPAPGMDLRQVVVCLRKGDTVAMVVYGTTGSEDVAAAGQQLASVAAGKIV